MQVTYINDPAGGGEYPCYQRPDGKGLERIWFPDGGNEEQVMALNRPGKKKDFEAEDEAYTDEVKTQYSYLREHGKFEPGKFPMVPPMREWVDYDF
jgi:nucleoporin NUP42